MKEKLPINPWLKIWVSPRETIRVITKLNPSYFFYLLSGIYGFIMFLQLAQDFSLGTKLSALPIVGGSLILSVGLGALIFNIFAALICWTGRWIGGRGSFTNVKAAVAWTHVPSLISGVVWLTMLGVFGTQIFISTFAESVFVGYQLAVVFFGFLIQIIAAVWGFFIGLFTIAEVQAFSAWKALLNIVITCLILMLMFWFVSWIFYKLMAV